MKIFTGCIAQETNTFATNLTGMADFVILKANDIADREPFGVWREMALAEDHEFIFSLYANARPSGIVIQSVYESLRDELLQALRAAGPVDIVLLALHGAMIAEGYDDCEGDMLQRVRAIVGEQTTIGITLDLHCHLTDNMLSAADIVITYKDYPHTDIRDRGQELFIHTLAAAKGAIKPTMAQFDCQMIGIYPTTGGALRDFIDQRMVPLEQADNGVISISFAHGFPHADIADTGSKMLVVTDNNPALAQELARTLGLEIFAMRKQIGFNSLSLDQAFEKALALTEAPATGPVVIADQADNTGAGAPGDSTYALRWLLDHGVSNAGIAIIYDPEVVRIATMVGVGATLPVRIGGKLGPTSGDPVDVDMEVLCLKSNYQHLWPQQSGKPLQCPAGDIAALRLTANTGACIDVVVSSRRAQCFSPSIFSDLGVEPNHKRLLVVKSIQHFYGEFSPIASAIIYMAGPGAVNMSIEDIPYQRALTDRKYPWVDNPHKNASD